jgi:hypothetical protein
MKYNIGDLFVYNQLTIGIITEYDDKHDLYTIEWMRGKERWKEQLTSYYIRVHIYGNLFYQHYPVK